MISTKLKWSIVAGVSMALTLFITYAFGVQPFSEAVASTTLMANSLLLLVCGIVLIKQTAQRGGIRS